MNTVMAFRKNLRRSVAPIAVALLVTVGVAASLPVRAQDNGLWSVYENSLKRAKYVDLTHTITPNIPVWAGFRQVEFRASQGRGEGRGIGQERRHLRLQEARLRGDGISADHRPARHAARSAGALGA